MKAAMMHGSLDQTISSCKSHLKNRKIIHQNPIFSNSGDVFRPAHFSSAGLLQPPPPPLFHFQSYPPYTLQQPPQPPLLPLPSAAPRRSAAAGAVNKKTSNPSKSREPSLTPKKSKSTKKVEKKWQKELASGINESEAGRRLEVVGGDEVGMFSGAVMLTISPPPSSLPLPTFSLRRCKAEAAGGVDAGATDDLRRLLRLR